MTTPAQAQGFIENVTRLKLTGNDGDYHQLEKLQSKVWFISSDDGSSCPYFEPEGGGEERCFYLRDMSVFVEAPPASPLPVLGQFIPKPGNLNQAFAAISKEPTTSANGFLGRKVSGEDYHVLSEYWDWVDALPAIVPPLPVLPESPVLTMQEALAAPLPVYTELQQKAINTFQTMYEEAVKYREGLDSRLNGDYGICDNIDRFASSAGSYEGQMSEVKENLIRKTASYSGNYTYPVPCPDGGDASNAFSRHSNKWRGAYGLNRLVQLEQLVELIKTKWDDSMVNRKTPAFRNGLKVGDIVRYTRRENTLWVFRRDDESMSPSFHKLGDKDDYVDIDLNYVVKVDKGEVFKQRSVSEFLSEIEEHTKKQSVIELQIAELQKQLKEVKAEVVLLDYGLADQHKVKRLV